MKAKVSIFHFVCPYMCSSLYLLNLSGRKIRNINVVTFFNVGI